MWKIQSKFPFPTVLKLRVYERLCDTIINTVILESTYFCISVYVHSIGTAFDKNIQLVQNTATFKIVRLL